MAVLLYSENPEEALAVFVKAVQGFLTKTWSHTTMSKAQWFTHTGDQWHQAAWFKAIPSAKGVTFVLLSNGGVEAPVTRKLYNLYHGQFVYSLLEHTHMHVTQISATANPLKNESRIEK